MNKPTIFAFVLALLAVPLTAAERKLQVTVNAGKHDRAFSLVRLRLNLPAEFKDVTAAAVRGPGENDAMPGQLAPPPLLAGAAAKQDAEDNSVIRDLHFLLPRLKPGESGVMDVTISTDVSPPASLFQWHDTPGEYTELRDGQRPVLRYMYKKLDDSGKANRELTYKVFHHLYDPTGTRLVTKGPGGQYTHHRGLFYGFNRVSYADGKKRADVWHCTGDAHQSHQSFVETAVGPVFGRHQVKLGWHGPGKERFAEELREMTAYRGPKGYLIEFASRLTSKVGTVKLDGDPQHAGFHFRADNEVSEKTKKETYYLRTDGRGKPGETRNWDAKKKSPKSVNLPWNVMSFVLGGKRYTAVYLDHPANPKEARYSERDYGRFGSYFEHELKEGVPLDVKYRLLLQEGEIEQADAERLSRDFVEPVEARVRG